MQIKGFKETAVIRWGMWQDRNDAQMSRTSNEIKILNTIEYI